MIQTVFLLAAVIVGFMWLTVVLASNYSQCARELVRADEDYDTLAGEAAETEAKLAASVKNRDLLRKQVDRLLRQNKEAWKQHKDACKAAGVAETERAYLQDLLARTNTDRNRALEMARVLEAYRDGLLVLRDEFVQETGVLITQAKEVTDWPFVPIVPVPTPEEDSCETSSLPED